MLAANRAARRAGYPWALAGLFSTASVAFNVAHAPDRPVARLVFAMAPVALVLTTHLVMQQVGWHRATPGRTQASPVHQADLEPEQGGRLPTRTPARVRRPPAQQSASADQSAPAGARARVRAAYKAQVQAGQTPTGAGLARAAGVSERYGQRLLAEFTTEPGRPGHRNGDGHESNDADVPRSKGGDHG